MRWWPKSKWQVLCEAQEKWIDQILADVAYFKEREARAVASLLDIQGKPALERPDATGAMNFIDKSFSLFNDTQGGEEVA